MQTKRSFGIAWLVIGLCRLNLGRVGFQSLRPGTLAVVLILLTKSTAVAIDPASLTNNLELIPENESLWKESLLWDKDVVLRAGVGYKNNVLLSPNAPQGSGFFTSGLDLTIFRLPLDGWQFDFTVIGDDVRYFRRPDGLAGEDLFIGSAQLQRYFAGSWRAGLELRGSYVDQVLQEFLTQGGAQAIEAKGQTLGIRPFIRRDLSTNWWVQLEAPLARDWWQAPLDDSWKFGGQAVLGFSYGSHSHVTLSGGGFFIPHDEWLARDALGNELGYKLALWRQVAELKWEHQWDSENHWSSVTRLAFNRNRDNGGGFYNYYRYSASQELHFRTRNWEAKAGAGFSYYDFPIQTIAPDSAATLHLATVAVNARLERRIYKTLRAFLAYEYEQTVSDDPASEYRYDVVTGGISWEF